jgi:GNAT superfamily N-acetyltransferase
MAPSRATGRTIRPARPADAGPIAALVEGAYAHYVPRIGIRPLPMEDDYAARVERGEAYVLDGGEVDGVLVLERRKGWLLVDNVAVRPGLQRRGLGRRLLAFAERRALAEGLVELRLYTNERMWENRRLYARLGWEETGHDVVAGRRRVWMRKRLPPVRLRPSGRADAGILLAVQRAASLAALGHIFPPDRHPFPDAAVRARWDAYGGDITLAEQEGRPVGLAATQGEWLDGLYVVPAAWGTGVAALLHDDAVERISAGGHPATRLWCLAGNERALRFYRRRGWREDGTTRVVPHPPHPLDLGMRLALA